MKASPYLFFSCPLTYSCSKLYRLADNQACVHHNSTVNKSYLCLLHGYVHVPIQASQDACKHSVAQYPLLTSSNACAKEARDKHAVPTPVVDPRVQLHHHWLAFD